MGGWALASFSNVLSDFQGKNPERKKKKKPFWIKAAMCLSVSRFIIWKTCWKLTWQHAFLAISLFLGFVGSLLCLNMTFSVERFFHYAYVHFKYRFNFENSFLTVIIHAVLCNHRKNDWWGCVMSTRGYTIRS